MSGKMTSFTSQVVQLGSIVFESQSRDPVRTGNMGWWGVVEPFDRLVIHTKCFVMFLDGALCDTCRPLFDRTFNFTLIVDVGEFAEKVKHFKPAHVYLDQDVTKSKLRGPYRIERFIWELTHDEINKNKSRAARVLQWVHQTNDAGEHICAYRYTVYNNSGNPMEDASGVFIRDTKIFHQYGLELWFHPTTRKLTSLFPSGPGYCGNEVREFDRISEKWINDPSDQRFIAIQLCKFNFIMST